MSSWTRGDVTNFVFRRGESYRRADDGRRGRPRARWGAPDAVVDDADWSADDGGPETDSGRLRGAGLPACDDVVGSLPCDPRGDPQARPAVPGAPGPCVEVSLEQPESGSLPARSLAPAEPGRVARDAARGLGPAWRDPAAAAALLGRTGLRGACSWSSRGNKLAVPSGAMRPFPCKSAKVIIFR